MGRNGSIAPVKVNGVIDTRNGRFSVEPYIIEIGCIESSTVNQNRRRSIFATYCSDCCEKEVACGPKHWLQGVSRASFTTRIDPKDWLKDVPFPLVGDCD
jgi:hypothetical protein